MNERIEEEKERLIQLGERIPCPIWGSPYEARRIPDFFSDIHYYYSPRAGGVFRAEDIDDYHYFASQSTNRRQRESRFPVGCTTRIGSVK